MELEQRHWIRPEHLNVRNRLFGGLLLSWLDEESSMLAHQCVLPGERLVTVGMDATFMAPGKQGDLLLFTYKIVHVGNSSITVLCEVYNDENRGTMVVTAHSTLASVDVDDQLQSIPLCEDFDMSAISTTPEWEKVEKMKKEKRRMRKSR